MNIISVIFVQNIFCKEKYDFRNCTNASDKIVEEIKSRKLIFIGDIHSEAGPMLFLAENLERFYEAGVRYLFFEEKSNNYIENPEQLDLFVYPPWGTWGYKYEYLLMENEILKINKKHSDDPLKLIWPEQNLVMTQDDLYQEGNHVMNLRDSFAQKNIIEVMDNTNDKGLIFYGTSHGQKKPFNIYGGPDYEGPDWKMIGSYMDDHYGSDYVSFLLNDFNSNKYRKVIYNNDHDCKVIPEDILVKLLNMDGEEKSFDYYCTFPVYKQAVPAYYASEDCILNFLEKLASLKQFPEDEIKLDVWSKKSQKLLAKYYLAYHKKIKDTNISLQQMEQYHEHLHAYESLADYILGYSYRNKKVIDYILYNMNCAKELNSIDIWPQYWISYFLTEKAEISGKKKDYKKALAAWEELFQNDLLYESPVLKLAYQKIILCEEKLKDKQQQQTYTEKLNSLSEEIPIDYEEYMYFGY